MRNRLALLSCLLMVGCGSAATTPTAPAAATATATATQPPPTLTPGTPTLAPSAPGSPAPTAATSAGPTAGTSSTPGAPSAVPTAAATVPASAPAGNLVEVIAGGGEADPTGGGLATDAKIPRPGGIDVRPDGSIWIADSNASTVLVVSAGGSISSVATEGLNNPIGISLAADGSAYVADSGNYRVVSVLDSGQITVLAGTPLHPAFRGEGTLAKRAYLFQPYDVATDGAGNVYIADTGNNRIRVVDAATLHINTVAGDGTQGFGGDGGPATEAPLARPGAVEVDDAGSRLYIGDTRNNRIRMVDLATGIITTIAGGDIPATNFVAGVDALKTPMNHANAIALDNAGNLYVVVFYNDLGNVVMRIAPDGTMTRVVGGGTSFEAGVPVSDFRLPEILAMAIDPTDGGLLLAGGDGRVYRVAGVAGPVTP